MCFEKVVDGRYSGADGESRESRVECRRRGLDLFDENFESRFGGFSDVGVGTGRLTKQSVSPNASKEKVKLSKRTSSREILASLQTELIWAKRTIAGAERARGSTGLPDSELFTKHESVKPLPSRRILSKEAHKILPVGAKVVPSTVNS